MRNVKDNSVTAGEHISNNISYNHSMNKYGYNFADVSPNASGLIKDFVAMSTILHFLTHFILTMSEYKNWMNKIYCWY